MGKYKFYGNRFTKGPHGEIHPSIDLGFKNGKWLNIEVTESPTQGHSYTKFDENPNPNWREKDEHGNQLMESYFRRYVRKDPLYAMLNEYKSYYLVESDEEKIDLFLIERENNIALDKQRREAAIQRAQKNDAKLRYHQSGRSTNRHQSAHASLPSLNQKPQHNSRKKRKRKKSNHHK